MKTCINCMGQFSVWLLLGTLAVLLQTVLSDATLDASAHPASSRIGAQGPVLSPWVTPEILKMAAAAVASATTSSQEDLVAKAMVQSTAAVPHLVAGVVGGGGSLIRGTSGYGLSSSAADGGAVAAGTTHSGDSATPTATGTAAGTQDVTNAGISLSASADGSAGSSGSAGGSSEQSVASNTPACTEGCPPPPLWDWPDKAAAAKVALEATGLPVLTPKESLQLAVGDEPYSIQNLSGEETCKYHQYVQMASHKSGYRYLANASVRQDAQTYPGDRSRLRMAMARFAAGENITVSFVGGSITAGQGALDGMGYVAWAETIVRSLLGARVIFHNGAVQGTVSHYMSVCHNVHVPTNSDIVFVEYSVNDLEVPLDGPPMNNPDRRSFERLVRKFLTYPRRPAVILYHAFIYHTVNPWPGAFWTSAERDFHELALYYKVPELSVKAACWHLMKAGVEGYWVNRTRSTKEGELDKEIDHELRGKMFYWDRVHPDGLAGHKVMGEIVAQFLLDQLADCKVRQPTAEDRERAVRALPEPMLAGNWESVSDKCFIGLQLVDTVVGEHQGWEWMNDVSDGAGRPKFGFISDTVGTKIHFTLNTTSGNAEHKHAAIVVEVAHLRSYERMGRFKVTCADGCQCIPVTIDGHHTHRSSQVFLSEVRVSQSANCTLTITVLGETSSGQHKVKISGLMVSEEVMSKSVGNTGAIEMVNTYVSTEESKGVFDITKWG